MPIKLTDSESLGIAYSSVQYPTKSPFNCDNSKILILEPQNFALYDSVTLKRIESLSTIGDSNEPLWSKSDPKSFFYRVGNVLVRYHVDTKVHETVRTFGEYQEINGKGESELSDDGNHLVLCGDNHDIFLYELSTDSKGISGGVPAGFDSLYITPENNVLVSGQAGMYLFDRNMALLRKIGGNNGHKCCTRDANGDEILVWTDNRNNAITKIRLSDAKETILLTLDWSLACHITCSRNGVCLVETYDPKDSASTKPFANAIVRVPLDGSAAAELLKHASNAREYNGQPRASISRDGSRFVYGSNMGGSVTDVFYESLDSPPPQLGPTPNSVVLFAFPNQEPLTPANFPAKPGQAGFVYDGGDIVKLVYSDGVHKWQWPGILVGSD